MINCRRGSASACCISERGTLRLTLRLAAGWGGFVLRNVVQHLLRAGTSRARLEPRRSSVKLVFPGYRSYHSA